MRTRAARRRWPAVGCRGSPCSSASGGAGGRWRCNSSCTGGRREHRVSRGTRDQAVSRSHNNFSRDLGLVRSLVLLATSDHGKPAIYNLRSGLSLSNSCSARRKRAESRRTRKKRHIGWAPSIRECTSGGTMKKALLGGGPFSTEHHSPRGMVDPPPMFLFQKALKTWFGQQTPKGDGTNQWPIQFEGFFVMLDVWRVF